MDTFIFIIVVILGVVFCQSGGGLSCPFQEKTESVLFFG